MSGETTCGERGGASKEARHGTPRLSACLIVRDERARLERCLAALRPVVDEIVVADTGSADGSQDLARSLGARVIEVPWRDDFSAARNASLSAACGGWILVVDADEILGPADASALHARLEESHAVAFTVEVESDLGDGARERVHIARLFRAGLGLEYRGRIHESVLGSVCERLGVETWTPPRSGLRLRHDGYLPERRAELGKRERNARLLAAEIDARPEDPGLRFLAARELSRGIGGDLLDVPQSREALALITPAVDRLLALAPRGITEPAGTLGVRLATATGDLPRAEHWSAAVRAATGESCRWCYAEGERLMILASRGDAVAGLAAARFRAAAGAPNASATIPAEAGMRGAWSAARETACLELQRAGSCHAGVSRDDSPEWLMIDVWASARAGGPEAALRSVAGLLRAAPDDPRSWWLLGACLLGVGEHGRAEAALERALEAAPGWVAARALLDRTAPAPRGLLAPWTVLLATPTLLGRGRQQPVGRP